MCPRGKRDETDSVFYKYGNAREIDKEDIDTLRILVLSGQIEFVYKGKKTYAQASPMGKKLINARRSILQMPADKVQPHV